MKTYLLSFTLILFWILPVSSKTFTQYSRFSIKDGLSDMNVLCITQDSRGQMWFGTFNGLNKFNGYNFKTYKTNPGQKTGLDNFRIDKIKEDKKGYLWLQCYDGHVYRFDSRTETFLKVPQCQKEYADYKVSVGNIQTFEDGSIWMYTDDDGCFRVSYDNSDNLSVSHFSRNNDLLTSNKIKRIFQDSQKNTWVLTLEGVNVFKPHTNTPVKLIQGNDNGFISITQKNNIIWLGGQQGKLLYYNLKDESIERLSIPSTSDIIDLKYISDEELFILTNYNCFFVYNIHSRQFRAYNSATSPEIIHDNFVSCFKDSKNNIWIECLKKSIILFRNSDRKVFNLSLPTISFSVSVANPTSVFNEDVNGNLWIQPRSSNLCRYNPQKNIIENFYHSSDSHGQLFPSQIHCIFSDKQGNLWLSPYSQDIEKIVFTQSPFGFVKQTENSVFSSANEVRAIFQDDNKIVHFKPLCLC